MTSLVKTVIPFTSFSSNIKDVIKRNIKAGVSTFTYKNYIICLYHNKDEYLRVSCSSNDLLIELIPIGNDIMGMPAIATYDMDDPSYDELMPTVEWHKNPEARIEELRDHVNVEFKYYNLRICHELDNASGNHKTLRKSKMSLF